MKLLTVVIPAYNVEHYLHRCLDSLLYNQEINDSLDIIIVNDGSRDETVAIAEKYCQKYPKIVSLIDKENGGHGSTVNAGLAQATGKYFKVVDADDWVNIWDFGDFVKSLKKETADLLITDYRRDVLYDEAEEEFSFYAGDSTIHPIEDAYHSMQQLNFFYMHALTVKTAALKKVWGHGLMEKRFYVDQQFNILAFTGAKTYRVLPYDIYRYFIGRPEQSMNNLGKHHADHENIVFWMINYLNSDDIKQYPHMEEILKWQIIRMVDAYRYIPQDTPEGVKDCKNFMTKIKNEYPEFIKDTL